MVCSLDTIYLNEKQNGRDAPRRGATDVYRYLVLQEVWRDCCTTAAVHTSYYGSPGYNNFRTTQQPCRNRGVVPSTRKHVPPKGRGRRRWRERSQCVLLSWTPFDRLKNNNTYSVQQTKNFTRSTLFISFEKSKAQCVFTSTDRASTSTTEMTAIPLPVPSTSLHRLTPLNETNGWRLSRTASSTSITLTDSSSSLFQEFTVGVGEEAVDNGFSYNSSLRVALIAWWLESSFARFARAIDNFTFSFSRLLFVQQRGCLQRDRGPTTLSRFLFGAHSTFYPFSADYK